MNAQPNIDRIVDEAVALAELNGPQSSTRRKPRRKPARQLLDRTGNDEAPAFEADDRCADAELIALGEEYDRLRAEWVPLWRRQAELGKLTEVATQAATDALRRHVGGRELSTGEYMAAHAAASAATGNDAAMAANDAALNRSGKVADQIRATPTATPAGLLVKARVLLSEVLPVHSYIDVCPEDRDWPVECFFGFLADIERLTGRPS